MTDTDALEQAARAAAEAAFSGYVEDSLSDTPAVYRSFIDGYVMGSLAAVREADALREAGELMLSVLGTAPVECNRVGLADPICILHNAEWSTRNGIDLGHCEWIEAREQAGLLWRETATDARP